MELSRQSDFHGKNVHIIGMARSGLAAAEVLSSLGASVTMHDRKNESELSDALRLASELGLSACTGDAAYGNIEDADVVVTSPGVPETCPGLATAHDRGIPVMSEIELAYRISPAPIIAVTGTNGKTTTTALIGEILKADGRQVYIAGNIVAGEIRLPLVRAAFRASASDVIVAEISSFQLEWITSFRPRVAALLNVSADHMDRHPDMDVYARTKARIFEHQGQGDFAVLNADDQRLVRLASGINSRIRWFSATREVEDGTFARGTEVWVRDAAGEQFVCDTSGMKLRGRHNLENILAAAAASLSFGAGRHAVQDAVDSFAALEHRLEPVMEIGGVEFINNSMCTNVDAAVRSLEAIGRPAVVIAGGKDKGSDYSALGRAFVSHARHVVLIGADAGLIERSALDAGYDRITRAGSLEEAVDMAWQHAKPGDAVILSPACASFDMFKDFEHRGQVFKSAVAELADRIGARQ